MVSLAISFHTGTDNANSRARSDQMIGTKAGTAGGSAIVGGSVAAVLGTGIAGSLGTGTGSGAVGGSGIMETAILTAAGIGAPTVGLPPRAQTGLVTDTASNAGAAAVTLDAGMTGVEGTRAYDTQQNESLEEDLDL